VLKFRVDLCQPVHWSKSILLDDKKPPSFCFILNFESMLSLSSLKPTTYVPRYPRWMIGRPLLVATSALASLGDAMFGYSQGIIAANQVQPSFIKRMFGRDVTMEQIQTSTTGVNPFIIGAWFNFLALHSTSIFIMILSHHRLLS
jgi:hypothetical protein